MTIFEYIVRITILLAFLFNVVFGIVVIKKEKDVPSIFKVTFVAMISFFVARLYFLVLDLSEGNDEIFSVGVLGQVAGYLFLLLANKSCLPFKESESKNFSIFGAILCLIPVGCYIFVLINNPILETVICVILYLVSLCSCLYFAGKSLFLCKNNEKYKQLKWFNLNVCLLAILSSLGELIAVISNEIIWSILFYGLTPISVVVIALILPLLYKGLKGEKNDN